MRYRVHIRAEASQVIDVEADDVDSAMEEAMEDHDLFAKVSNRFDMGDPEIYVVYQGDGDTVAWEEGK